jgi:predicted N-acyltransferase
MITIECFKGLPLEYESFLIEKYNSFITTCRYIEIYYPNHEVIFMVVYDNGKIIELLVFGNLGRTSLCFNALVEIDQRIVEECTRKLFELYPTIKKVKIDASYKNYMFEKSVLLQESNDYILNLPSSFEDYNMELGSKTRKHLRQRIERLKKEFLNVNFITKSGIDIEEALIDKIIQFNINRMKTKGKIPGINDAYKNYMYKYAQHYGFVAYLELDGAIVAGCITTVLNDHIFLHVVAHDDNFSNYNVGEVCMFNLLQTCNENQISIIHFLWGESELKRRLQAKPHSIFSYFILRNYSLDYFFNKIYELFYDNLKEFKQSKIAVPLRNAIKTLRTRSLRA